MVDEHLAQKKADEHPHRSRKIEGQASCVVEDDEEEVDAAAATPTKKLRRLRKNSDSSAAWPSSLSASI